jgi:pimeloyl-ACP methyl ester carboxylesterase
LSAPASPDPRARIDERRRSMNRPLPFVREFGAGGVDVVCLHSNASSSSQWRALGETLAARFHVVAVDGYDAGKSPNGPAPGRSR